MADPSPDQADCHLRVLDLDLDFFIDGVAHWRTADSARLDAEEFPPWPHDEALRFLEERCLLDGRLPGIAIEHHRELFPRWRAGVEAGSLAAPFHVTHVDAHADLGLGEISYQYLMTELLFEAPKDRLWPREGPGGLDDGSFLAFAIACRWISDLVYVFNDGGGSDVFSFFREGFDPAADRIQLPAMNRAEMEKVAGLRGGEFGKGNAERLEPSVPFAEVPWHSFQAPAPFDFISLTRSPAFTPPEADVLFDEIRRRWIDESAGESFLGGMA
ncbi:MAG: UPF0489 family protein [Actinobacteria bacterium]|nr:UPF0489 family protein [Actinomycetota bacterium]